MRLEKDLQLRSNSKCELCGATHELSVFEVVPSNGSIVQSIYICSTCKEQIDTPEKCDPNHWRCLNDSMWSEVRAVQVQGIHPSNYNSKAPGKSSCNLLQG
jgi:protein PhnA